MSNRHGFSIGFERHDGDCFLKLDVYGKLTHEDYEEITPVIEHALQGIEKAHVHALFDIREFEGWDLHAAWDDFKLGLKQGKKFGRIALLGDDTYHKNFTNIGRWFIHGETEFFHDEAEALAWLNEAD